MSDIMNDIRVKDAKIHIATAAVMRLIYIAVLAVTLAFTYADTHKTLIRIHSNTLILTLVIIPILIADTWMTVMWIYRPGWFRTHLVLYIVFGGIFYTVFAMDMYTIYDDGLGRLGAAIYALSYWFIGLFMFILCHIGRKNLDKAIVQATMESAAIRALAQPQGDKND